MPWIRILEQKPVQDKDAYYSICAYDESEKRITVIVTAQALKDLKKFGCGLREIASMAVEEAIERSQTDGEVQITTQAPTFQHLVVWFRMVK